jgi:hypothetical protein
MGSKFDTDDIKETVYDALTTYIHTIITTYKWYDKNESDDKVCAYFDHLLVISALAGIKKPEPNSAIKNKVTNKG